MVFAVIGISQSLSFARRNPYLAVDSYVNIHANVLAAATLAIYALGILCRSLLKRIEKLEQHLRLDHESTDNLKLDRETLSQIIPLTVFVIWVTILSFWI